ncbi:DEAD/DEAH box helicase [Bacillus badius]|uniref:DEAD/DEAH box helicase n=1 Tax=Bacillus badius TaxID=1455 RepID=UPI002E1E35FE|nr:DEAD/DEAH box helicase [Bacillus badius]
MENFVQHLEASLHKGFINQNIRQIGNYKPKLLINNTQKNETVLTSIIEELHHSQTFIFSVAFITESGLATLKSCLWDLKKKGVKGRILTSTFLNFNQPKVFKELMKIANVEVRLTNVKGFHSKGYIFDHGRHYSLIVGSSNLTAHALKVNYEWNVKLTSHENGELVHHFRDQFEEVWEQSQPLTEQWIAEYEAEYVQLVDKKAMDQVMELPAPYRVNSLKESIEIEPNRMQHEALAAIQAARDAGKDKGLVVSATGTGKTYLAAFDVRRFAPKRLLFIVHREQIVNKAKSDFQKVLGGIDEEFGTLTGTNRQTEAKYLFATIQTLSKQEVLSQFDPNEFDYILIDEVHKAGAASYKKVIEYFQPRFLMGMTATPERTDEINIYELFDYNVAYEIRLQEALEADMLCPFHYFGVTDFEYNGEMIDDTAVLSQLVTEERVQHLLDKIQYYGFSGRTVKGLMFCSRKEEAKELSRQLNEKGLRTAALTGESSQEERACSVRKLEQGELDYILTVDIFNEGIDIPSINQVVMLRQTQSSIIFIQQLGRGLRKHKAKDFVTIIDFIGNYKNNYLIPVALSGESSQNKDRLRRRTLDTSYIKGISTINFEEVAKKKIFEAIDKSNLTAMKILKEAFIHLKNKIGRTPYLYDFINNHSIDPVVIAEKNANYHQFLVKMGEDVPPLTDYENKVLTMLSLEILNGKRKHEILLLERLLEKDSILYSEYLSYLADMNCRADEQTLASVQRIFDLSFFTKSERSQYGEEPVILFTERDCRLNVTIEKSLSSKPYFKELALDVLRSAKEKAELYSCSQPFTLYQKYTRKDACRLLNWEKNEQSTIYGYKPKHGTCPIFITYHKHEAVDSSVAYGDEFLSRDILKWYTRSNRKLQSEEVQQIIKAKERNIDIHIFVKKDDDEGGDFYYLGQAWPDEKSVEQTTMKNKKEQDIPVVRMNMVMEKPVDSNLYHYIRTGTEG